METYGRETEFFWEANSCSASQEIFALIGNRRLITVLTRARYCSLSRVKLTHSTCSYSISLRSILIIRSYILLVLSFRFSFQNFICISRLSHGCKWPACITPPPTLDFINLIMFGEVYKLWIFIYNISSYAAFLGQECLAPAQTPLNWSTAPCRVSLTAYSVYSRHAVVTRILITKVLLQCVYGLPVTPLSCAGRYGSVKKHAKSR
jgi:hypothetical protein